jgi:small subunit ribosomal protein S20
MPNIKSAKKRVKTIRVRTARNAAIKSSVKTAIRRFNEAVSQANPKGSADELNRAFSTVDRAAKKGVIHPNQAARRKSRLARRANKAAQAE